MMGNPWPLAATAFAASAVEAVEAFTIVLAVGTTTSWRAALTGTAWGLAALVGCVAVLGPLLAIIPLVALKAVVGIVLLLVGQAWLRKAILRAGGRKALRDEAAAFTRQVVALQTADERVARATAFGAVLLEGLEVALIVLTFGAASAAYVPAAGGALAAVLVVALAGFALRAPLAKVPENALKFAVGVMLTSFGTLWSGEALGIVWPLGDGVALVLALIYALVAAACVAALRRRAPVTA